MVGTRRGHDRVWWLNLDADVELARPEGYLPKRALLEQAARQQPLLDGLTLGEPQIGFQSQGATSAARSDERDVVCWCPTPLALRTLAARGYAAPRAPSLSTLQRVNHRRFLFELIEPTPTRRWVDGPQDSSWLDQLPPSGVRLKRGFGFAGRGQRVVRPNPSADDLRWVEDSLRDGLLLEPELDVRCELCVHGLLDDAGDLFGSPCVQTCDRWGRVSAVVVATLDQAQERELLDATAVVASSLKRAGYFGPFGVDFLVSDTTGTRLTQLSEVNARMTLGWSVGMGLQRETALRRLCGADNLGAQLL